MPTFKRPLPGARQTSGFGMRGGVLHAGIDIAAAPGTPIGAAAAGSVTRAGWFDGYGNCVDVNHGGGYMTRYAHMLRVSVRVGQSVAQGATLGLVGSTGDSTGPHLHFEIRLNGNAVNPVPYLNGSVGATNPGGFPAENVGNTSVIPGADALQGLEKLAKSLTNPRFWIDTGYIFLGAFAIIVALFAIAGKGTGSTVSKVAKVAKKVVK
jgi:peptidase M23-like protein